MSIANKLEYLQETKNQIKTAITEKGVTISDTDTFRSYANKIRSIEAGGTTSSDDWQPEPDWWDIETILENDTEDYAQKIICLLTDELDDGATTNTVQGGEKYKLSDGQVVEQSASSSLDITNKFDTTQDKVCNKGYKTRYIIYYRNSDFGSNITLPNNVIYVIFSGVKFSSTCFSSKRFLQAIKFVNDTKFTSINMTNMFSNCYELKQIPNMDTSNVTSMSSMFLSCSNLKNILNLNMNKVTNANNMLANFNKLINIQNIYNIKVNISFSNSSYLNHSTLLRILNALVDLTDQTTQTLTLGSTNLAKLTDEEKAIATNKNWTLA